ncbi:hypothetical protein SKAU_G00099180 [Synaphobranchus kaupii]|uniref:Uncharacterized protein n=1 Tax=Synaphobranchus kaupii TaxID=118154 RepID=A0A9Q1FY70_SYNKA|nr:hypothetical protein SKAU_G00099180 [Synaphobranchus kaupii]
MLRAQVLTEDQQVDFVLGALEGRAWREVQLLGEQQTIDHVWEVGGAGWAVWPANITASNPAPLLPMPTMAGGAMVTTEARTLDRDLWREGSVSQTPVASLATQEPPVRPEVDLEQWKEKVKNQLAALGRTLVAELRQQCKVAVTWCCRPPTLEMWIRTTQAPAGAGSLLDLPEAKGLTPVQQKQFRELIQQFIQGVCGPRGGLW